MVRKEEQLKMKQLLVDAITLLCRSGMQFETKFCVEALIGITIDEQDVVLVSFKETVSADGVSISQDYGDTSNKNTLNNSEIENRNSNLKYDGNSHGKHNSASKNLTRVKRKRQLISTPISQPIMKNEPEPDYVQEIISDDDEKFQILKNENQTYTQETEGDDFAGPSTSNYLPDNSTNQEECFFVKNENEEQEDWNQQDTGPLDFNSETYDPNLEMMNPGENSEFMQDNQFLSQTLGTSNRGKAFSRGRSHFGMKNNWKSRTSMGNNYSVKHRKPIKPDTSLPLEPSTSGIVQSQDQISSTLQYILSQKQKVMLVCNGYVYRSLKPRNKITKVDKKSWRCIWDKNKKCKGRCKTMNDNLLFISPCSHGPNASQVMRKKFKRANSK